MTAAHDISDGGLGLAVIEMALAGKLGAELVAMSHAELFGEDQARYLVTCPAKEAAKIITQGHAAGVDVIRVGTVTGDGEVSIAGTLSVPLPELRSAHEGWFPAYMSGEL